MKNTTAGNSSSSVRAGLALVLSLVCGPAALSAGEFTTAIASGEQLTMSIAGNTSVDIWVIDLSTNQTVVQVVAAPIDPYASWTFDYYFNGGPTQSGPISFVVNNPNHAAVQGLPAGNYKVLFGSGTLQVYDDYQMGSTYYFFMDDYWSNQALDLAFEVY